MLLNLFVAIAVTAWGMWGHLVQQTPHYDAAEVTRVVSVAETEFADAYACPQKKQIFEYINSGMSETTDSCSPVIMSDAQETESLGFYPMTYLDMFDIDFGEVVEVEVFRVNVEGVQMFAIIDMLDEHLMEQKVGLRPSVAYDLWEGTSSNS